MSIASHSNDHRLGANEAPPSIISVYLGEVLGSIFESLRKGETLTGAAKEVIDMGVGQLAHLLKIIRIEIEQVLLPLPEPF